MMKKVIMSIFFVVVMGIAFLNISPIVSGENGDTPLLLANIEIIAQAQGEEGGGGSGTLYCSTL
jgi:hypothetical protein